MSIPATGLYRILMFAIGTAGDVYPAIAIGRRLRELGHDVVFIANSFFEPAAKRAGLEFLSIGTAEEYLRTINDPDLWKFGKGFKVLFAEILRQMRGAFDIIRDRYIPGGTIVVAPSSVFGARIANEKLGVPLVTMHLQPIILRTLHDQPGVTVPGYLKPFLRPVRRTFLAALDRWVLNPALLPETNAFRAELDLPPLHRPFDGWIHSPQLAIGLFPEWFAPLQPDWPPQLRLAGFPICDEADGAGTPPELAESLDGGEPSPIVFVQGTGMRNTRQFFEASIEACRIVGRPGIFVTRFRDQLPSPLPPSVRHFDYVPFSALLPRAAAFVHHGGVGTMAQGLQAGVPQLITPFNFDQPDNAARVRRLGVGDLIRPRKYTAATAAAKLQTLITSEAVAARCREVAKKFRGVDSIGEACRLIESVMLKGPSAK